MTAITRYTWLAFLLIVGALMAPTGSMAADLTVVADPAAQQVTALGRTIVWVTGMFGHQQLMRRTADGLIGPVSGTAAAASYRNIDLGYDRRGRLRLTYLACSPDNTCPAFADDLQGHPTPLTGLAPRGCVLATAPAYWRTRSVYGLQCREAGRGGLFVKVDGRRLKRLPLPAGAARFGIEAAVKSVDLRGTRVAALVESGTADYALSETVTGRALQSFLAADSEGDTGQTASGPALGTGGAMWTLTDTEASGDSPLEATIERFATGCLAHETLLSLPGPTRRRASARPMWPSTARRSTSWSRLPESSAIRSCRPGHACRSDHRPAAPPVATFDRRRRHAHRTLQHHAGASSLLRPSLLAARRGALVGPPRS